MRVALCIVLALVVAALSFYGIVIAASESGEVVVLTTSDGKQSFDTRLWIVDYDGAEWVRTGHSEKGWYRRIGSEPQVVLERNGFVSQRLAVPVTDPEVAAGVNAVFSEKYGIADRVVALSGDARKRVPVRLDEDS